MPFAAADLEVERGAAICVGDRSMLCARAQVSGGSIETRKKFHERRLIDLALASMFVWHVLSYCCG
jgi:hypothetical protein